MTNEDKSPADRLEQALRDLETRKKLAAETAAKMAPERERLAALQAELDALPQNERREVLDAMGLKHVSAAPSPITPIRGRSAPPPPETRTRGSAPCSTLLKNQTPSKEIEWPFWKSMRTVKLWQACALITGLDPDSLKQSPQAWMAGPGAGPVFDERCFPNPNSRDRFSKALRLAANAVSYMDGPIFPKGTPRPGNNQDKDVSLDEVAAFFRSCEWPDIPEPMQSVAAALAPTKPQEPIDSKAPVTATPLPKQMAQEARVLELLRNQGYDPLKLAKRAPGKPGPKAEIKTLALNETAMFTAKTFDTTWERLRGAKAIAGAE